MAFHGDSHLFKWSGLCKSKTPGGKKPSDHLRDHDDSYTEAQALLSDWTNSKLQLELQMGDDDDLKSHSSYRNFDELYSCLSEEREGSAVKAVLQNLMEREVLDGATMEELVLDEEQRRKKVIDPVVTMEARHLQVRQNRAQREVERLKKQSGMDPRQDARREAKRREEMREMREVQRQEHLLQTEMARLRYQMRERRRREQLGRQREKGKVEAKVARGPQSAPLFSLKQQHQATESLYNEHNVHAVSHMHNLKCLQKHFSIWRSAVLDRRLLMEKMLALYDWKRKLRAWRAWQVVVWAEQRCREVGKVEQELLIENRKYQIASENNRKRMLQRCLTGWQLWCHTQREQGAILAQQQEMQRKMAALINVVSVSKIEASDTPNLKPLKAPTGAANHWETTEAKNHHSLDSLAPAASADLQRNTPVVSLACPSRPGHVTRHHGAPTAAELQEARRGVEGSATSKGAGWWHGRRTQRVPAEAGGVCAPQRQSQQSRSHPIITAMEARVRQRAERRREIEELKRKKAEEKLAAMKVAEEQMEREKEEEKRQAAQKRREEKRLEKEREEEKQRQLKRQHELQKLARQHYCQNLLSRRGLLPWKRLIDLSKAKMKLADTHYNRSLLRQCVLGWSVSMKASQSDKQASADQLYQRVLIRRTLSCWKGVKVWRKAQEERADHLYHSHTLRKFLLALCDHVTQQRLLEWNHQDLAQEHHNRRLLQRCFLAWVQLPHLQREERVKEGRRERLAQKVIEVLPDFRLDLAETF